MQTTSLKPYFLLILLCLLLYLPGISTLPITDRDASHFAQATKQMLETGNYLQVKFQNRPRHLKPPGIYWLQALTFKLTRVKQLTTVWPYRLPSAFGALLAVLLMFAMAKRFVDERIALLAAAMLAASLLLVIEAHLIVTDAMLLLTMVAMQFGLWRCYHAAKTTTTDRTGALIFWVGMAAGVLIKGITPLVGFLTILGLCLLERDWRWLRSVRFSWGLPLLLLLTLLWLVPVSFIGNSNFLIDMLKGDVLPKLAGGQEHHGMPPGFFIVVFNLMFWSASMFVWQGVVYAWRERQQITTRFLLAWLIPSWIFFECVPTKLPQYVLPLYPAIALLIALGIHKLQPKTFNRTTVWLCRLQYLIWSSCGLGLAAAILLGSHALLHHITIGAALAAAVLVLSILFAWYGLYKSNWVAVVICAVAGSLLFMALLYEVVLPSWQPLWLSQRVKVAIQQHASTAVSAAQPLQTVGYAEPSLVFLLGTHAVHNTTLQNALSALATNQSQLLLIDQGQQAVLQHALTGRKLSLRHLATISGSNYSRSHAATLLLYLKARN